MEKYYKKGVISEPDVRKIVLSKDHEYLIIATDGLWDVCEDFVFINILLFEDFYEKLYFKLKLLRKPLN